MQGCVRPRSDGRLAGAARRVQKRGGLRENPPHRRQGLLEVFRWAWQYWFCSAINCALQKAWLAAMKSEVWPAKPGIGEMLHHRGEESPGDGEIEDHIALRIMALFRLAQFAADRVIQFRPGQIAPVMGHLLRKPLLCRFVKTHAGGLAGKILQHAVKTIAPAFGGPLRMIDADQRSALRSSREIFVPSRLMPAINPC